MKNKPWMMLICCLLPLLLIFLSPVLGIKGNFSNLLYVLSLVACPVMMIMMMSKGGGCGNHQDEKSKDDKEGNEKKQKCH